MASSPEGGTTNVLVAGIGGQGAMLAAELVAHAAMDAGRDVRQSELHGVAQRGGAVVSHVRFGERVYSPLCRKGTVKYLLALEKLEALRWAHYLSADGLVIMADEEIPPVRFEGDKRPYPSNAVEFLAEKKIIVRVVAPGDVSRVAGSPRGVNVALAGLLSVFLPFSRQSWIRAMDKVLPPGLLSTNTKAFDYGAALVATRAS
jgi:indolepyruvate ferredoxin oxidoreductase beta subunit